MIVMPGSPKGWMFKNLHADYPGRLGWMLSPHKDAWKTPVPDVPFALDNGAWKGFDKNAWGKMMDKHRECEIKTGLSAEWLVVPDKVGDWDWTWHRWLDYCQILRLRRYKLAYVVQDNVPLRYVPPDCDVLFVGGSMTWKKKTLPFWVTHHPRVHVGRCNNYDFLWRCHELGVESVDGTGWFRQGIKTMAPLERYLRESSNAGNPQQEIQWTTPTFGTIEKE